MDMPTRYFYIKFKIDTRIDKMTGFMLSEEKANVDAWTADKETDVDEEQSIAPVLDRTFKDIAKTFPDSIEVFRKTAPFIMQTLPLLRQFQDDSTIRRFVKEKAEQLDTGEFETYKMEIEHLGELDRRLREILSIASGVKNLPNMFVVGLVSAFDAFLAQIIRVMLLTQPGLLSASDRNISFKDLMEIGSIELAREKIIEKEVESVLRESHVDQFKWLERKLEIPLRKDLSVWPVFIELCEWRNLLTHTGGIISSQYIEVCKNHGCDTSEAVAGQALSPVDPKYYARAVETVLEIGSKLIQVIWRKLIPADIQEADETLNRFAYDLIFKKMYALAATMLRFGLYEMKKHGSEAIRRQMVVNYANAEKLGGNKELARKILDEEDWTASTNQYRICVAAVKDDLDTVLSLMKSVVNAKLITLTQFREWPVFETIRSEGRFIEAFEREFGQKLLADKQVANLRRLSSVQEPEDDRGAEKETAGSEASDGQARSLH